MGDKEVKKIRIEFICNDLYCTSGNIINEMNEKMQQVKRENSELRRVLNEICTSTSWKVTKPLRIINGYIKKIKEIKVVSICGNSSIFVRYVYLYWRGILKLFGKGKEKCRKNIIAGYVICAGLFHIISTPFMYYELSFSPLVYICIAYSVVIIAAYIILKIKEEKTLFERVRLPEKNAIQKDKVWLGLSIVFIIAFQIFYVVYYQHTDIDDSYYLAQINTIIHTNKISAIDPASGIAELNFNPQYKMVSYEVLMSFIVRLFHVNTAFLCIRFYLFF